MLRIVLISIVILSATALYTLIKLSKNLKGTLSTVDKLVGVFMVTVLVQVSHAFLVIFFLSANVYLRETAPYALIYGPFIYFGLSMMLQRELMFRTILLHLLPAVFAFLVYSYLLINSVIYSGIGEFYILILHITVPLSMIAYVLWGIWQMGNVDIVKYKDVVNFFSILSVLMIMVALLFLIIVYTETLGEQGVNNSNIPSIIVYSIMLISVAFIFQFRLNRLIGQLRIKINAPENKNENMQAELQPYQKSTLTADIFLSYHEKLHEIMEKEKLYLNKDLSLSLLAKRMKVPKHHVTQMFTQYLGKSFYNYTNDLRIEFSCKLLADPECELTIEAIAEESGFNSKASFNRYFKTSMGCTPSEFRTEHQ
ncbi:helix-turn-helix domain-containing protein [Pseudopedobacter beijingensis]|uniref:Helix-turn-helix domain-containing protein n=1 Tax=Pseudopedobacter beijingensis TaxID=1207056 RepID=A0ABW4I7D2_9SPHI